MEFKQGCSRCGAVFDHFQHHTLQCGLAKIIIAPHLIFAVTCAVQFCIVQSIGKTLTVPHLFFCNHMCGVMYMMWFEWSEVGIFFKFQIFPTQFKTNFSLCFGPNFKLLSQFFLYFGLTFLINTCQGYQTFFFENQGY